MSITYTAHFFPHHQYAHAAILSYSDGSVGLLSYNTVVAEISPDGWLIVRGLYSNTTRRHIGWFMKEFGFQYSTARDLYLDNMMMNLFTGEVKEVGV